MMIHERYSEPNIFPALLTILYDLMKKMQSEPTVRTSAEATEKRTNDQIAIAFRPQKDFQHALARNRNVEQDSEQ